MNYGNIFILEHYTLENIYTLEKNKPLQQHRYMKIYPCYKVFRQLNRENIFCRYPTTN